MNDDQYLLANAYADGELTASERVLAEADPDVMSEVEQLLTLQAQLRSVDPPSDAVGEAAIAAAMAAFTPAAARPAPPINAVTRTVAFGRRPSYFRYLGLAAAVVAVGLLGLVAVNGLRGGDDDSAASEPALDSAEEPADEAADEISDRTVTESAGAELADQAADGDAVAAAAAPVDESAADVADQPADDVAEEPAEDAEVAAVPITIDPTSPLTAERLGAYGAYLLQQRAANVLPPTPETSCPQPGVLSRTDYVFDGLVIEVLIAVDETQQTVTAVDPDTCEPIAVGPLF